MFNRGCLGQAGCAAGVDIDHGVIVPQILLSDGLRGLPGQLRHQVRHPLHVRDGVRRVELHVRRQLSPDLGYGRGGLLGEDDSLALDHSECVKEGALKTFYCSPRTSCLNINMSRITTANLSNKISYLFYLMHTRVLYIKTRVCSYFIIIK